MSLGDLFPEEFKENFAKRSIDIGQALLIQIDELNVKYPKYVILVSKDSSETIVAYVIINTRINETVFPSEYLKSLHITIDKKSHPFLEYDSYVNCSSLKSFNIDEVIDFLKENPERAVGNVSEEVLRNIHITITGAKTIDKKTKEFFGF